MTAQTTVLQARRAVSAPREATNIATGFVVVSVLFALVAAQMREDLLWIPAAMALAGAILTSPRIGLYCLVVGMAIDTAEFDPITKGFGGLFRAAPGLIATPVELVAVGTLLSWSIHSTATGGLRLPTAGLLRPVLILYAMLLLGWVNGVARGADSIIGLWEVRALLMVLPVFILTVGLVQTPKQLRQLAMVALGALLLMSLELAWRYLTQIKPAEFEGGLETAFNHDGALLIGFAVVASAAWAIWGPNRKERLLALMVALAVGAVLLTSRRRAALIATEGGLVFLMLTLLYTDKRRFLTYLVVAVVVFTAYLGVFWNSDNALGQPARAFQTVFQKDSLDSRDQSSDDYRRIENFDSWQNIRRHPIDGIGFGTAYEKPIPLPNLGAFWPFWDYTPHNTILWLWMKAGIFAFIAFFYMVAMACSRAVEVARKARNSFEVVMAGTAMGAIAMLLMFAYVDLGLTSTRLMILFGLALGVIAVLHQVGEDPVADRTATEPALHEPRVRRKVFS